MPLINPRYTTLSDAWKQAITNYLNDGNDKNLQQALRIDWIGFYPEDKEEIFRFLYLNGSSKLFLYFFAVDLQSHIIDLPWNYFVRLVKREKLNVTKSLFEELERNLFDQNFTSERCDKFQDLAPQISSQNKHRHIQSVAQLKQELLASARIAQSEGLVDQHVHYMNELKKMAPNEFNVTHLITNQEKQRAERILSRRQKRKPNRRETEKQIASTEEKQLIQGLNNQAQEFLKSNKAKATDFAYLFRSLGEHSHAIEFLQLSDDISKKDWQLLDYLFSGKQYVSLLDHCLELKRKYSAYPDALFSVSYAEAVAYWELGEKEKAIDLMGQISAMRPDFKSATETLNQWKEDGFE